MDAVEVVRRRLRNQRLVAPKLDRPADVVRWLGAVQAQDYLGSLWGIGLRTTSAREVDVERAVEERAIVRTWPMRGTLHFVAAEDVRWMLRLLAPRVIARSAGRRRQLGLDATTFTKSRSRLERALGDGGVLTRPEVYRVLERSGIVTTEQRGIHILGHLAMQGVLCLGPRRGRQPTFTLLEQWLPPAPLLDRDEALGELALRYFTGHGPATVQDFAWWSGLPLGDARRGLDVAGKRLTSDAVGDTQYWSARSPVTAGRVSAAHLLPAYDESTVAYFDRSAFLDATHAARTKNGIFSPVVLVAGRIAGTWRRRTARDRVVVTTDLFERPSGPLARLLDRALARYGAFLGLAASFDLSASFEGRPSARKSVRSGR
ncbi:MAG TPA: winged helix DNA-binding domain-containing protein [Polyangiaceae bacterium]|jgi:hypothetical protein